MAGTEPVGLGGVGGVGGVPGMPASTAGEGGLLADPVAQKLTEMNRNTRTCGSK